MKSLYESDSRLPQCKARFPTHLQSGVASATTPQTAAQTPHEAALRARHTRAPKRQPPRPPRPPCDGRADDQQCHYSWRLTVPVGSAPGEWPQDSALELAEEAMYSTMENDLDVQDWVRREVIRQVESLFVPLSAGSYVVDSLQARYMKTTF
jgi:hypothetical protein